MTFGEVHAHMGPNEMKLIPKIYFDLPNLMRPKNNIELEIATATTKGGQSLTGKKSKFG